MFSVVAGQDPVIRKLDYPEGSFQLTAVIVSFRAGNSRFDRGDSVVIGIERF
jgi:hypothetical protein